MCTAAIATRSSTLASAISACAIMWRWSASVPSFVSPAPPISTISAAITSSASAASISRKRPSWRNEWTLADRYATEMFDRFPEGWSAERYRFWLGPAQRPLADHDGVVLVDLSFQVYTPGHRRLLSA